MQNQNDDQPAAQKWEEMTSRENCKRLPHLMVVLAYITREHGFPKHGWARKGLSYHYTDAGGLLGILSSNRIWASDITFMNDPSEGKYFPDQLISNMSTKAKRQGGVATEVISSIISSLNKPTKQQPTLSVSFCSSGDLLSQWRGYGSFGAGYSIGFDINIDPPHAQIGHFIQVCYGDEGLDELASDLLDIYVGYVEGGGHLKNHLLENVGTFAAETIGALSATFKEPSYSEEQEVRIISSWREGSERIMKAEVPHKFRHRNSDIIPYSPIPFDIINRDTGEPKNLPIKEIIIGPGVDPDRNAVSLERLLDHYGYEGVAILRSGVPFRA